MGLLFVMLQACVEPSRRLHFILDLVIIITMIQVAKKIAERDRDKILSLQKSFEEDIDV